MKYFATITGRKELYLFHAKGYEEANFICGGFEYIELASECPNCRVKRVEDLIGYEQELYRRLKNRDYSTLNIANCPWM